MPGNGSTSRHDEENVALIAKGKKKFKKGPKKSHDSGSARIRFSSGSNFPMRFG